MDLILLSGLAFISTSLLTLMLLRLAVHWHWFDIPNQRSSHAVPTPKAGGIAFASVFIFLLFILYPAGLITGVEFWLFLLALIPALAGLLDDFRELPIPFRLMVQGGVVVSAVLLLPASPSLPLPIETGGLQPMILLLCIPALLWLINLYNFMDGIDGLAAAEGIFVAISLAILAGYAGAGSLALLMLILASAIGGFLYFNLSPARIFMGDAGSNFLGYVLGAAGLLAASYEVITLWTLLILLGAFIVDSTMTLYARIRSGVVWYHGHRTHAYQLAARRYKSHLFVTLCVTVINVCWLFPLAWLSVRYAQTGLWLTLLAWLPLIWLVIRQRGEELGRAEQGSGL